MTQTQTTSGTVEQPVPAPAFARSHQLGLMAVVAIVVVAYAAYRRRRSR